MAVYFCDTDCELWHETAAELGVKVIQMPYIIGGEEVMDDLGADQNKIKTFYKKMREGAAASTAGLNEAIYYDYFEPYFKAGEDILYVAFSSQMSGTFRYLENVIKDLKSKYPNVKYRQFDTLNISMGAGIIVWMGAKFFNANNKDIDKTYDYLTELRDHISVHFVVDDMKYLARGGRISPAKARLGNLMQIKPILAITPEGTIDVASKQNGLKKAHRYMLDNFAAEYKDYDNAPIIIVDADCPEIGEEFTNKVLEINPSIKDKIVRQPVGPVIGAHCGPGTIGFIYTK